MNLNWFRRHHRWLLLALLLISVTPYLAVAASRYRIGFPLDDAWIHQTYARNLVETGRWTYTAGSVSGGSTAPLWTLGISLGYLLRLSPKLWAYLLGSASLLLTACLGMRWYQTSGLNRHGEAIALGSILLLEWHLVWAAVSGMETLLMGTLALGCFLALDSEPRRLSLAGMIIGVGIWVRPDALLLLLPALWTLAFRQEKARSPAALLGDALRLLGPAAFFFVPYLLFNFVSAGSIWPTTFFAKQAEYAVLLEQPLLTRLLQLIQAPLAGAGILLLPGMLYRLGELISRRQFAALAPFLWVAGYIGAYTLRLPVTYQHGRYLIPIIPVSLVIAFSGWIALQRIAMRPGAARVIARAWSLAIPVVLLAFWVLGANAYAQDVAIIESEMVDTARWIDENTPGGAKIAAHDIGAVGYFSNRELLDLAGLVSEEVIPVIRDEQALKVIMDREAVDYLMTFPGWYPYLSKLGMKVYESASRFSPNQGGENMAVFRWP